jgi:membrane protease subunit HflK
MSLKRIYTTFFLVVLAVLLGIVAFSSWYTVDQSEQAVIQTFGKVEEGISGKAVKRDIQLTVRL